MADPPRFPRQPPPLPTPLRSVPPRPVEPFVDLTQEERAADTERSFPRRDETPPPALDALTESTAQLLRRELALTRETLPTLPTLPVAPASLPPPSVRTRSRALLATFFTGKFVLAPALLIILARWAQKHYPQFADVIDAVVQVLPQ